MSGDTHQPRKPTDLHRRRGFRGLYFDEFDSGSAWIRESAEIVLPADIATGTLVVHARYVAHPQAQGRDAGCPGLRLTGPDGSVRTLSPRTPGPFKVDFPISSHGGRLRLELLDVGFTNTLAWAGRVTGFARWQRFRAQNKNRQLRIDRVEINGEVAFDFSNRHSPRNLSIVRRSLPIGMNIAGYLTADLGIGESARCMVRAADAAGLPVGLVNLRLPVKSTQTDETYRARLQLEPSHPVNVVHLDPPGAPDVDHHHGAGFRHGRYHVGYWAWELPEFPDSWIPYFDWYDEIWCPSEFVREAISAKAPVPVLTMPHAISFARPTANAASLRDRLGLPQDRFLFLFIYDLNSYSVRKNPQAVVAAFRASGLAERGCALVIKVHGAAGNEAELAALKEQVARFPSTTLITQTLGRSALYELQAACDCFVSLHRSEGFGLSVAECMYLGKPVIATDWSATTEFLNISNGAPVRAELVKLQQNVGPYAKGQTWADPDPDHAADWMRRLHADPDLRARLGLAARTTIEQRFAPAVIGERYRRRLEVIALR
ncbi:MAG TPA: glycosyltransferase family 4 protein [Opitutaceae bacterium]